MSRTIRFLALLLLASACEAADGGSPAPQPTPGQPLMCGGPTPVIVYEEPGCDGSAKPSCQGGAGACASPHLVCGCDGKPVGVDCAGRVSVPHQFRFPTSPADLGLCKPVPGYDAGTPRIFPRD